MLYAIYYFEGLHGMYDLDIAERTEEQIREYVEADVNFNYWELDMNKIPTSDIEELRELFNEDWEEFINKYAVKE